MLVDDVDIGQYIYYVPGKGWPRVKDDAPDWVREYVERFKYLHSIERLQSIKVE